MENVLNSLRRKLDDGLLNTTYWRLIFWFQLSLFVVSAVLFLYLANSRPDYFRMTAEEFTGHPISIAVSIFYIFLINYALLAYASIKGYYKPSFFRKSYGFFAVVYVILLCATPFLSRDMYGYLIEMNNYYNFHQNIYHVPMNAVVSNPWLWQVGPISWLGQTASYGPMFYLMLFPLSIFFKAGSIMSAVLVYKLLAFAAFMVSIWVFRRIVKKLKGNEILVYLYALNPAVLIQWVAEGHNEVFAFLFLLAAILLLIDDKWQESAIAMSLSVAVKYFSVVLLPIYFFKDQKLKLKRGLIATFISAAGFVVTTAFFEFPFKSIVDSLKFRSQMSCFYHCSPVVRIVEIVSPDHTLLTLKIVAVTLILIFIYKYLYRDNNLIKYAIWAITVTVFFTTRWLTPWYLMLPAVLSIFLAEKQFYLFFMLGMTFYSLMHYFGM